MSSSLSEWLEENSALDALSALEAAGIERPSDLHSLTADDLASLGVPRRQSLRILSADGAAEVEVEEDLPAEGVAAQRGARAARRRR